MVNGNTTIGNDLTVTGDIVVSSDARLKANIVSLGLYTCQTTTNRWEDVTQ